MIQRYGLNIIWSHFWLKDNAYSLIIQQDRLICNFFSIVFKYGLLKNGVNFRWTSTKILNSKAPNKVFFFIFKFKSILTNSNLYPNLKISNNLFYFMKFWIFRYQYWLIILLSAFVPIKTSNIKYVKKRINTFSYARKHKHSASTVYYYRNYLNYTMTYNF